MAAAMAPALCRAQGCQPLCAETSGEQISDGCPLLETSTGHSPHFIAIKSFEHFIWEESNRVYTKVAIFQGCFQV